MSDPGADMTDEEFRADTKAQSEVYDALAATVVLLAAPHENHTGMPCYGGRSDCCWRCSTLEGLVDAVRETNSLERSAAKERGSEPGRKIVLPEWCASVRNILVIPQPAEQFRHEHCQVCGHRDTRLPPLTFDQSMRRYYTEDMIEMIGSDPKNTGT